MIIKGKEYLMVHITTNGLYDYETEKPIEFNSLTVPQRYILLNHYPQGFKPLDQEYGDVVPVLV